MIDSALPTDLHELYMMRSCRAPGMQEEAMCDCIVRALPAGRNFLAVAMVTYASPAAGSSGAV